jgi:putative intracellular protease/amidase
MILKNPAMQAQVNKLAENAGKKFQAEAGKLVSGVWKKHGTTISIVGGTTLAIMAALAYALLKPRRLVITDKREEQK